MGSVPFQYLCAWLISHRCISNALQQNSSLLFPRCILCMLNSISECSVSNTHLRLKICSVRANIISSLSLEIKSIVWMMTHVRPYGARVMWPWELRHVHICLLWVWWCHHKHVCSPFKVLPFVNMRCIILQQWNIPHFCVYWGYGMECLMESGMYRAKVIFRHLAIV